MKIRCIVKDLKYNRNFLIASIVVLTLLLFDFLLKKVTEAVPNCSTHPLRAVGRSIRFRSCLLFVCILFPIELLFQQRKI